VNFSPARATEPDAAAHAERARQNEQEGGPAIPDGFTLDVNWWKLDCPNGDWTRSGNSQAELEQACGDARDHYADAHPASGGDEDDGA
jgi:hypothetical protein